MDSATLWIFVVACIALAATPGPDMLLVAARSVEQGPKAGFATLAGVQAGVYCHALAAALGLAQIFVVYPVAYDAVRYAGAAYLLFVAWQTLRAPTALALDAVRPHRATPWQVFRHGLWNNLLNPKMALFVLALFPQFVDPAGPSIVLQMMVLATILNAIGVLVNGVVILAASRAGEALARPGRFSTVMRYCLAGIFAGLALRLIVADRP
jgi:threonine/homoserine/homoserine lactone efflux protein